MRFGVSDSMAKTTAVNVVRKFQRFLIPDMSAIGFGISLQSRSLFLLCASASSARSARSALRFFRSCIPASKSSNPGV